MSFLRDLKLYAPVLMLLTAATDGTVDTTFTQFYPTAKLIAVKAGTCLDR